VYVGGAFTYLDGLKSKYLGELSRTKGTFIKTFKPAPSANVYTVGFTSTGKSVWVGGDFTSIGGRKVSGLAAVSSTTGKASTWTPSPQPIRTITVSAIPGTVCAGTINNRLGCYNTSTGKDRLYVKPDGDVQAVSAKGSTVYAGGHFNNIAVGSTQVVRQKLAAFSLTNGALSSWAPVVNSALGVFALSPQSEGLYIGGDFTRVGGVGQEGVALLPGTP
jgi:hypothetical protein